jgi:hypothetical protein
MGDGGDRSRELPQRVRGTARGGPDQSTPSASPVLSEELRQRIQAAVKAERNQAAAKEQQGATKATEQPPSATVPGPADRQVESPAVNGHHAQPTRAKPEQPAKPNHAAKPKRTARAERPVGGERNAESQPVAESETVVKPLPARHVSANHKPTTQLLVRTPDQSQTDQAVPPKAEVPKGPRRRRIGVARLVGFAVGFITIGALGVVVSRYIPHSSSDNGATSAATSAAALHHQELAAREQAASWVAQQVDQKDLVACDRVMCAALEADKFPSHNLIVLSSSTSTYPLNSAVVVDTATVRSLFGTSLANAYAPDTLASFGSGVAEISVRVIALHGAVPYRDALNADLAQREVSGRGLAGNTNRITFSGASQNQLVAGQVDSRLILAITGLAVHQQIDILRFENIAPGGDADLPLRFADLAENDPAANMSNSVYLKSMTTFLATHYRLKTVIVTENGQPVVRVEFTAPSPLGLFNGGS